jgi:transposase
MSIKNPKCPKCSSISWKNGFVRKQNKQRFKCSKCGHQFVEDPEAIIEEKPEWMRVLANLLYMLGLSMNAIARLLKVSTPCVFYWIRNFAKENYSKPSPGEAIVMELDEMWHYVGSKKTSYGSGRLLIELQTNLLTGSAGIAVRTP